MAFDKSPAKVGALDLRVSDLADSHRVWLEGLWSFQGGLLACPDPQEGK